MCSNIDQRYVHVFRLTKKRKIYIFLLHFISVITKICVQQMGDDWL